MKYLRPGSLPTRIGRCAPFSGVRRAVGYLINALAELGSGREAYCPVLGGCVEAVAKGARVAAVTTTHLPFAHSLTENISV